MKHIFLWAIASLLICLQSNVHADDAIRPLLPLTERGEDWLHRWLRFTKNKLKHHSQIAYTSAGRIEYVKKGDGPVVLCLHGAPGGYDQSYLIGANLIEKGFTVLAVSRPGYLRTPLSVGQSVEQQADAMAALLRTLNIDKVAVIGFQAGAQVAFQLALRHPHRVWALVTESLGAPVASSSAVSILNSYLALPNVNTREVGSWHLYLATRYYPKTEAELFLPRDTILTGETLEKRIKYVKHHKNQRKFMKQLIYSFIPVGSRTAGLANDIQNADLWLTFPLNTLHTHTMIIQADASTNGTFPEAVMVAGQIPEAKLLTVGNSGDFLWLGKQTNSWERKLTRFLKKHQRSAH